MPASLAARGAGHAGRGRARARIAETFEAGLQSFVNEARLLAQFDHPSLVKVYRFWEANGTAYMVMPFYEGIDAEGRARASSATPPDEAWLRGLLAPLIDALDGAARAKAATTATSRPTTSCCRATAGRCCSTSARRGASSAT